MSNYTPVIIIGAGRSGTNMLREILTSLPEFDTWDCDEINPIWRYGNKNYPTDELPEHLASKRIKKYINKRFLRRYKKSHAPFIVEKTCANSLRLNFVHQVIPDAKFIIINRDGRDVVPSAMKRWNSSFDLKYTLKKLRYVPLQDLFYYVWKFGYNRLKKTVTKEESLSFWGPIYKGIDKDVVNLTLLDLCAQQWMHCAENTIIHRQQIETSKILDVRYEDFVLNPQKNLEEILKFLKVESKGDLQKAVSKVSIKSVGNYKKEFSQEEQVHLNKILKPTLEKLNYSID